MNTGWKALLLEDGEIRSKYDHSPWKVGEWREVEPPKEECKGLCCSPHAVNALSYVDGDVVALVEYDGVVIASEDKLTCQRMRILKVWPMEEYKRIQQPARSEYERIQQAAWYGYLRIERPAYAEYKRIQWAALAEYLRIRQPAWDEYERINQKALAEYQRIEQAAWEEYKQAVDDALLSAPPMLPPE